MESYILRLQTKLLANSGELGNEQEGNASCFIYDDQEIQYKFNDNHPFNQDRLIMTVICCAKLARSLTALCWLLARLQIQICYGFIQPAYIEAVKALSCPVPDERLGARS